MTNTFDIEYIRKLKAQDPNAFNNFYLQTVDMFFRYIHANYNVSKQDAEDIISNFYVKFWEWVKSFKEDGSFSAYFWTIFKNTLKDFFKKHTDTPFTHLDNDTISLSFEDTLIDDADLTELLEQDFTFEHIQNAMQQLDDSSKDMIYFKCIEEKTYEEITILTWLSNDVVRQRFSRAIKQLKKLLNIWWIISE